MKKLIVLGIVILIAVVVVFARLYPTVIIVDTGGDTLKINSDGSINATGV